MSTPRILSLAFVLTATFVLSASVADAASRVFKTVDKNGNVTFTDVPPADAADPVELNEINAYQSRPTAQPRDRTRVPPPQATEEAEEEPPFAYEALVITAPANDEAVRENSGNVTISVDVGPSLQSGDRIEILVDGSVAVSGNDTALNLTNVDRGTHSVVARVIGADGTIQATSPISTFHMLRATVKRNRPGK